MDLAVAGTICAEEMAAAKALGYERLTAYIGDEPITKDISGRDGNTYQVEVNIFWEASKDGPIWIIVSVDDGSFWQAVSPLSMSEIVHPPAAERS